MRIVGNGEWLDEFLKADKEGKVALLLGKRGGGHMQQSDGGGGVVHSVLVG